MTEFTIWARITHSAPQEFVAIASAIPLRGAVDGAALKADVMMETCTSRQAAEVARDRLAVVLGKALRERGDQVLDVEVE